MRRVAAHLLWLACGLGGVSAALEIASGVRAGRSPGATLVGALAGAALGVLLAGLAALPATGLLALARHVRIARFRGVLVFAAACAAAWWLSEPLRRRMFEVYVLLCAMTGAALALAAWLGRKRAAPEIAGAWILALAGAASTLAIGARTYEELQDLGFLVAVAGTLAGTAGMLGRLQRSAAAPVLACAALLAALGAIRLMDRIAPEWRADMDREARGAARCARAHRALFDFDRDGYSPILHGGDCDDLDGEIHPLAPDRPGGGDQNCNGVDAPELAGPAERGLAPEAGEPALAEGVELVLLVTVDCWRADALDPVLMPEVWGLARGGLRFERVYAAASYTHRSLPLVVGAGPEGPWVGEIAGRRGIQVHAVVAGPIPTALWGFPKIRNAPDRADLVTDAALAAARAAGTGRQLLWVHYFDLHALAQYREEAPPPGPGHLPGAYRAAARHVDRAIGRLVRGLGRPALVLMTGDHGEGLGAHGVANHSVTGFEEVLRVPAVLVGPGIPAASVPGLVSHRDVPATLLGAFGFAAEARSAERFGRSWLRLRQDPLRPLHTFVVSRTARQVSGRETKAVVGVLVDRRYKLVAGLEDGLFELYDLVEDPTETDDLADRRHDLRVALWRRLAAAWDIDEAPPTARSP